MTNAKNSLLAKLAIAKFIIKNYATIYGMSFDAAELNNADVEDAFEEILALLTQATQKIEELIDVQTLEE